MNLDPFWKAVDGVLDRIASEKPNTFDGVKAIPDTHEAKADPDEAFFAGSGGDRSLYESLDTAGAHLRHQASTSVPEAAP